MVRVLRVALSLLEDSSSDGRVKKLHHSDNMKTLASNFTAAASEVETSPDAAVVQGPGSGRLN
ncbi:3-phosphoshikimate 1-carboxyvinyltransferase [Anopheles sinensis]|uniref:3-phosphoshikimate 1-carboxyvinyltransferase n=1 Tax=Anopheles sinensis TaxID=74873 RepID=A0A084WH73_ANOSI|nr:3-phosphoshikimate 1-carboxyvinyltransferase [Anopheles sinensis]